MSGANVSDFSEPQHRGVTFRASVASDAAIVSGASFGIYLVRELIGVGTTASVYRAYDTRLLREVAIKVLNTRASAGAVGLSRFLHEARMAAAIRHPNVVSILDLGVHDGAPYIIMELLSGEDLDARLNAVRALRERTLVDIAVELASGLAAVHEAGVVHRDVRPSNVFLARGSDGCTQPKLLDFGLSKQTRDNLRLTTNGRRRWAAMPLYTAPEVLLDGQATFHSDQYSFGVLLYECVTGVNPFRADTSRESIELITSGRARRISDQPIQPSRRLAAIIEKAMHVYPDQRFSDMRELGRALASVSEGRALWRWASTPASGPARPLASSPWARSRQTSREPGRRWSRGVSAAIGMLVIACSIGAPLLAWSSARRHRAGAPLSVASPLGTGGSRAPSAAPDDPRAAQYSPAAPCAPVAQYSPAARCPPAAGVSGLPLAAETEGAAAMAPAQVTPPEVQSVALAPAGPLAFEHAAAPPPSGSVLEPGGVGALSSGNGPPLPPHALATPEGDILDSGVPPRADGAVFDNRELGDGPLPTMAAPSAGHERGTNGALIFD